MGVTGLWNLIEDSGKNVNVETLRSKVLAIDLSIWINQSIKGFRDANGKALENAHILGLFHRVCKLLFYNIKPIFVFDGDCPTLKSRTLAKRREKTRKDLSRSKNISLNVLEKYINSQLGGDDSSIAMLSSAKNKLRIAEKNLLSELFLPPKPESRQVDIYEQFVELNNQIRNSVSDSDSDHNENNDKNIPNDGEDDASYHVPESQNIRDIDFNSDHFKSLPATTRYEILVEMRESYKGRKNPFPEMLPSESDVFSQYQMRKLLKKRSLQEEIDKLIAELNDVTDDDTLELLKQSTHLSSDLLDNSLRKIAGGRLASDEATRFLLLKTSFIRDKVTEINENEKSSQQLEQEEDDEQQSTSRNFAYHLPNAINDSSTKSDLSRIECLSQVSTSTNQLKQSQLKQLVGHLDANIQKMSNPKANFSKADGTSLDLSDSDSSTDKDDFVEVEPLPFESSQDSLVDNLDIFKESLALPYNTDIQFEGEFKRKDPTFTNNNVLTTSIEISTEDVNNLSIDIPSPKEQDTLDLSVSDSNSNWEKHDDNLDETPSTSPSLKEADNEASKKVDFERIPISDITQVPEPVHDTVTASSSKPPMDVESVEELLEQVKESNKIARQAMTVNQQIVEDCQELLRLFGVPWVVAPAEAEAQCAALEELGLCEGSITDDSDVFLFGGKRVYRHFFTNAKFITQFEAADLKKYYGLDQSKLICLGMLCGTDYTLGIDGIGPVTGLELLSEFPGEDMQPLVKFAEWYRNKMSSSAKSNKPESTIRSKLLKFIVPSSFPNRVIFDAYRNSNVDHSREAFSWSSPQLSELRRFAAARFGWSETKADSVLLPVLKNLNEKKVQSRIEFFFPSSLKNSNVNEKLRIKRSKRLNEAIRRNLQQSINSSESCGESGTRSAKRMKRRGKPLAKSGHTMPSTSKSSTSLVLSEDSSSDSN